MFFEKCNEMIIMSYSWFMRQKRKLPQGGEHFFPALCLVFIGKGVITVEEVVFDDTISQKKSP